MEVYLPYYCRPPNKLIRYEERPFDLGFRSDKVPTHGVEVVAIYKDKSGKEQEMTAQVKWADY